MKTTIHIQKNDGTWLETPCLADNTDGMIQLWVPAFHGTWIIDAVGMVANIGGNDWRIYDLDPDDCARICDELRQTEKQLPQDGCGCHCPDCGQRLKEINGNDDQLECSTCNVRWAKYVVGGAK